MTQAHIPPETHHQVQRAATSATDGFLQRLADALGARSSVSVAYGTPVQRGDVTVIPVAKVRWAFGGGGGAGNATTRAKAEGTGGGGGSIVTPIGYIELRDSSTTFHRIRETAPLWALPPVILSAALAAFLLLRGLAALSRR